MDGLVVEGRANQDSPSMEPGKVCGSMVELSWGIDLEGETREWRGKQGRVGLTVGLTGATVLISLAPGLEKDVAYHFSSQAPSLPRCVL